MSRKWKITLGVLAVVVVFCLWYTRPRSFEELVGDVEFQNFSMVAITMDNKGEAKKELSSSSPAISWIIGVPISTDPEKLSEKGRRLRRLTRYWQLCRISFRTLTL